MLMHEKIYFSQPLQIFLYLETAKTNSIAKTFKKEKYIFVSPFFYLTTLIQRKGGHFFL